MIIDFHSHFGKESNKNIDIKKIKLHLKQNGISKVILFSFGEGDLIKNSINILNLSKTNNFIIPFLRFDPNTIEKNRLKKLLNLEFKGIKLHPASQKFNPLDKKFDWIYKAIEESNLPIIFHCKSYHFDKNSHPEKLLELAKRYPNLLIIFGHFAGVNKRLFKEYVKHKNIYVETSIDVTPNAYRDVVLKYGFDRLLFGTDFPFSLGEIELPKLKYAQLGKEITDKILFKNAEEILHI